MREKCNDLWIKDTLRHADWEAPGFDYKHRIRELTIVESFYLRALEGGWAA